MLLEMSALATQLNPTARRRVGMIIIPTEISITIQFNDEDQPTTPSPATCLD
jgi:hypothetical protein